MAKNLAMLGLCYPFPIIYLMHLLQNPQDSGSVG